MRGSVGADRPCWIGLAIKVTSGRSDRKRILRCTFSSYRSIPGTFSRVFKRSGFFRNSSPKFSCLKFAYKSAGNTWSSHWVIESRKLATITTMATVRARAATTPAINPAELAGACAKRQFANMRDDGCFCQYDKPFTRLEKQC